MFKPIYLDNAATTPALPAVANAVQEALLNSFGNPSSLHHMGVQAEAMVRRVRRTLASYLGVPERGLYFTSGGTEANNLAIRGVARAMARRGRHIVVSAIEHAAVLEPCRALEQDGWQVTRVSVDSKGQVDPEEIAKAISDETVLVSIMTVNNEVGTIQPIQVIAQKVKQKNRHCYIHTDAVQALGKVPFDLTGWGMDLATFSAHKIHGPKGCGALWIREGVRVEPLMYGGGQEQGIRSGTENVPGIAGFGAALDELNLRRESARRMATLRQELIKRVQAEIPDVIVHGADFPFAAPHICSISIPGLRGEVMVHALAEQGVYVSSGAACSSHHHHAASHVLQAMGLPEDVITGTLRFGLSTLTSEEDISQAVDRLASVVQEFKPGSHAGGN